MNSAMTVAVRRSNRGTRVGMQGTALALRMLVVDDNPISQKLTEGMLRHLGFDVDVVPSGAHALEALQRQNYALVLMDCQMPLLDGYETTRKLRSLGDGVLRDLPVIAMTNNSPDEDLDRCHAAGMNDILSKPINFLVLGEKIKVCLAKA